VVKNHHSTSFSQASGVCCPDILETQQQQTIAVCIEKGAHQSLFQSGGGCPLLLPQLTHPVMLFPVTPVGVMLCKESQGLHRQEFDRVYPR